MQRHRLLAARQAAVPGAGEPLLRLSGLAGPYQLERELPPAPVVEDLGEQLPVGQIAVAGPGGLDMRGEVDAHPGKTVRTEAGGIGVEEGADGALLLVEMDGW
ncbi:hypothetical protein [Streptomyces turgidiscabies]|uniref:hypothetical protein n=1 Tax=Streptomyces turgidiscabies TaxID=85558 RepID=UPI0027D8AD33|nr:hypothetical protein [Streptomyces turgidiscabies]